jgi:hypothetical protein
MNNKLFIGFWSFLKNSERRKMIFVRRMPLNNYQYVEETHMKYVLEY